MTSEQVMLTLIALALSVWTLTGCAARPAETESAADLSAPYAGRQVWAVAPLRNESGSRFADGVAVADRLTHQFEQVAGIDTVPLNRVLAAMDSLQMGQVTSEDEALRLLRTLNVDGLVVGTVTAFDPYDPPRLGLAVELYTDPRLPESSLDLRRLSRAPTGEALPDTGGADRQPVSVVSGFFDAADPEVRAWLDRYARGRGRLEPADDLRIYRLSMDRFTEFVTYAVSVQLMQQETLRLHGSPQDPTTPGQPTAGEPVS